MLEVILPEDGEFFEKLESLGKSGQVPALEGLSAQRDIETIIVKGRTQLSDRGIALIVNLERRFGGWCSGCFPYNSDVFAGIFGDYNPETGELSNVHVIVSDDLLAVRRACLMIENTEMRSF